MSRQRFDYLLEDVLADKVSEAECAEFRALLYADEDLLDEYLDQLRIHSLVTYFTPFMESHSDVALQAAKKRLRPQWLQGMMGIAATIMCLAVIGMTAVHYGQAGRQESAVQVERGEIQAGADPAVFVLPKYNLDEYNCWVTNRVMSGLQTRTLVDTPVQIDQNGGTDMNTNMLSSMRTVTAASLAATMGAVAVFAAPLQTWTREENRISNGDWVLNVADVTDGLSIRSIHTVGTDGLIDLSGGVGGQDIVEFDHFVFAGNQVLADMRLAPGKLKVMGSQVFINCSHLTNFTAEAFAEGSVMYNGTFRDCVALESDFVSSGLSSMGEESFWGCASLKRISLTSPQLKVINVFFAYGATALKTVELPPNLIEIRAWAFRDCHSLETVTPLLPATVEVIGNNAFYECRKLTGELILASIQTIGEYAFANAFGLTGLNMSSPKLRQLDAACFLGCTGAGFIIIGSKEDVVFGGSAFHTCPKVTNMWFHGKAPSQAVFGNETFNFGADYTVQCRVSRQQDEAGWLARATPLTVQEQADPRLPGSKTFGTWQPVNDYRCTRMWMVWHESPYDPQETRLIVY